MYALHHSRNEPEYQAGRNAPHLRLPKALKEIQAAVNTLILSPTAALAILEAGDDKAQIEIFEQAMADYDAEDPDSRPWSVQRIRKAVDELGKKPAVDERARKKLLTEAGLGVRKHQDGYRLSFDLGTLGTPKQVARKLEAILKKVEALSD